MIYRRFETYWYEFEWASRAFLKKNSIEQADTFEPVSVAVQPDPKNTPQ